MSDFYMGSATISRPLSREVLKPVVQKMFEQVKAENLSYSDFEKSLDVLETGGTLSPSWIIYPDGFTGEDDEVYVPVDISVKPIDEKSFKFFFIPYPSFVTIK